jgi:hypothetical protein
MNVKAASLMCLAMSALTLPAHAVDGCTVLLCLAGNWSSIPQCVPPVVQTLHDLALGKPFPFCDMGGAPGAGASLSWASPTDCPPQYLFAAGETESGQVIYQCSFSGVIHVTVNNAAWSDVWWSMGGDSVTNYLPPARAQLGANINPRFDQDFAAWQAAQAALQAQQAQQQQSGGGGS